MVSDYLLACRCRDYWHVRCRILVVSHVLVLAAWIAIRRGGSALENSRWKDQARPLEDRDGKTKHVLRMAACTKGMLRNRADRGRSPDCRIKVQITLYIYGVKAGRGGHPTSSKNKSSIFAFIPMYTFLFRSLSLLPSPFLPAKFRDRSARANPSCCIPQAGSRRHLDPV